MNKNILITGGSKGIGYGTAKYLLERDGYTVVLVARDEQGMNELRDRYPAKVFVVPFDLTEHDKIEEIFKFCLTHNLKLDGMLHAAGISEDIPLRAVDSSDMKRTFDINYFAAVQLGRFFSMKKYSSTGASAIYMSSLASYMAESSMSQYVASKCAVNALVKVMAKEGVRRKLRINAIAPGFVDTRMTWRERDFLEDFEENLIIKQPFGVIPIEQIACLVEFLLSERSAFITGAIIPVTGGQGIGG